MSEQRGPHGPYGTDSEAMRDSAHVYQAYRAAARPRGLMDRINEGMLLGALREAGVELGAYDERIAGWLAEWEPHVVQVLVGWLERAHAAGHSAGNLDANWWHHVAAQRKTVGGDDAASTAPMHLGDLAAGEWTPACGQPYGADVTSERAAVTCPACVELLPPAQPAEPEFTPDEVDAERALDDYLTAYPTDGPDGGA